jgi:hypothetical protein
VQRRAHDRDPDDLALEQEAPELVRLEPVEPGPEAEVRIARDLGLQADEVLDGLERRELPALEEQLAREGRPVEGPAREEVCPDP